jgi:hypothetical protein
VTAGLPIEEILCNIQQQTLILYINIFITVHNFFVYWYTLMYKYRSRNGAVKLILALKDTGTDLSIGSQIPHSSRAITGKVVTCLLLSI